MTLPLPEDKKERDRLGAGHLNEMSRLINILGAGHVGSYGFGDEKGAIAGSPPFEMRRVEITNEDDFEGDTNLREIKLMYYDTISLTWEIAEEQGPWPFDPLGESPLLEDTFIAYFDIQRGAYVPTGGDGGAGGQLIAFTIVTANCEKGYVTTLDANIHRYTGCGTPPIGAELTTVRDPDDSESSGSSASSDSSEGDDAVYRIYDYFGFIASLENNSLIGMRALAIWWNQHPGCTKRWDLLMVEYTGDCP